MTLDLGRRRAIAQMLRSRRHALARAVTDEFLRRHPDWLDRFGEQAWIRGEEDAGYHIEFLAGAIVANAPDAFRDYACWTARVLDARGIAMEFLAENLDQVRHAVVQDLDPGEGALIDGIIDAGIQGVSGDEPPPGTPSVGSATRRTELSLYIQAVLAGERRAALAVALEAIRSGVSVPDVYAEILQPAQYEIGRRWERNEITVATEHMATAITQYVVAQLYSHLEIPATVRGRAVVTGVRGELHQLGANMVADVLEADGWNVRFLGTHLPHAGVLQSIEEHEPRLVGVSATILFSLPAVAELIEDIRRTFGTDVVVMVGGTAFGSASDAWRDMGADGFGGDVRDAVATANRLAPDGTG